MAYLDKGRTCDLEQTVLKLGSGIPSKSTLPHLKAVITDSKDCDKLGISKIVR